MLRVPQTPLRENGTSGATVVAGGTEIIAGKGIESNGRIINVAPSQLYKLQ